MSTYTTEVHWKRNDQPFIDNRYSRKHLWRFDGGIEVAAPRHIMQSLATAAKVIHQTAPMGGSVLEFSSRWRKIRTGPARSPMADATFRKRLANFNASCVCTLSPTAPQKQRSLKQVAKPHISKMP